MNTKSFLILLIGITVVPCVTHAQGKEPKYNLKSNKASGEKDVDASYYIFHDTLFSSKWLDNKKIAVNDIDLNSLKIEATGGKELEKDEAVYTVLVKPKQGKTAYKSFGDYAYNYGFDSRTTEDPSPMYVWIAGKEAVNRFIHRIKGSTSSANDIAQTSEPMSFSLDFNNLFDKSGKIIPKQELDKKEEPTRKTDPFSNDFSNLFNKVEEKKEPSAPSKIESDLALASFFGGDEVSETLSKKEATPNSVTNSNTTTSSSEQNTNTSINWEKVNAERQVAYLREIQTEVERFTGMVQTIQRIGLKTTRSYYKSDEQEFKSKKSEAIRKLESLSTRFSGNVPQIHIDRLKSLSISLVTCSSRVTGHYQNSFRQNKTVSKHLIAYIFDLQFM